MQNCTILMLLVTLESGIGYRAQLTVKANELLVKLTTSLYSSIPLVFHDMRNFSSSFLNNKINILTLFLIIFLLISFIFIQT